jgi:hypothetical protein
MASSPSVADSLPEGDPPPVFRLERRWSDRWSEHGVAVAFISGGERFGQRFPMRLLDASEEGLGARCDRAIDPGTLVTVGFAAPGWPLRSGVVLRCVPCGDGYRLAIRFEVRAAA